MWGFPLLSIEFFIVFINFFSYLLSLFLYFTWMNPLLLEVTVLNRHIVGERVFIRENTGFHLSGTPLKVADTIELLLFFEVKSLNHIHASLVDVVTCKQRASSETHKCRDCIVGNVLPVKCRHVFRRFMCLKHWNSHTSISVTHEATGETGDKGETLVVETGALLVTLLELSYGLELSEVVLCEPLRHRQLALEWRLAILQILLLHLL